MIGIRLGSTETFGTPYTSECAACRKILPNLHNDLRLSTVLTVIHILSLFLDIFVFPCGYMPSKRWVPSGSPYESVKTMVGIRLGSTETFVTPYTSECAAYRKILPNLHNDLRLSTVLTVIHVLSIFLGMFAISVRIQAQ